MWICVDGRVLQDKVGGGVQKYARHLLDAIFSLDKENNYIIFTNSFGGGRGTRQFSYSNVFEAAFSYPNKIFNALILSRRIYLDEMAEKEIFRRMGEKIKLDAFWAPNLNFINLRPQTRFLLSVHDVSFITEPRFFAPKERIWHKLINPKRLFNRANALLPVSYSTASDLERIGAGKNKMSVIYPAAEQRYFQKISEEEMKYVRGKYNLPKRFMLVLAAKGKRKNFEGAIKAFKNADIGRDIKLIIAGFGMEVPRAYDERIIFLGAVAEADLPAFYKAAEFFIYPSFYEGFGLPVLEAAASGIPVITSSATSMPEILRNACILVDPHDISELAVAMELLSSSDNLRRELGMRGRERATRFSWETAAENIILQFEGCNI